MTYKLSDEPFTTGSFIELLVLSIVVNYIVKEKFLQVYRRSRPSLPYPSPPATIDLVSHGCPSNFQSFAISNSLPSIIMVPLSLGSTWISKRGESGRYTCVISHSGESGTFLIIGTP